MSEICGVVNLTSHPVCGYDGPSGSIFLLNGTGEAFTEDGWRIVIGSSVPNLSLIAYVHDPQGKQIGTYSISATSFAEEALKLAKAKKAERESSE